MSFYLDQAAKQDKQRACDLADNDALEAARIQADLEYLANREKRDRERLRLLHELELNELRAIRGAGW